MVLGVAWKLMKIWKLWVKRFRRGTVARLAGYFRADGVVRAGRAVWMLVAVGQTGPKGSDWRGAAKGRLAAGALWVRRRCDVCGLAGRMRAMAGRLHGDVVAGGAVAEGVARAVGEGYAWECEDPVGLAGEGVGVEEGVEARDCVLP